MYSEDNPRDEKPPIFIFQNFLVGAGCDDVEAAAQLGPKPTG
jgi:hypothetical protein